MTDPRALAAHRARISPEALFLHQRALDEVQDRLTMVNKTFTAAGLVTGHRDFWQNAFPEATIYPDTDTLAAPPQSHDLMLHMMNLHWANDPVGQLIQSRRALKPDGLLMATCLGGQTLHELRRCLGEAEIAVKGGLSPRIAPMAELRDLGALLQRAGVALPVADTVSMTAEYRDIWHLMRDLRHMGESNALADRIRHFTPRALLEKANALYLEHFSNDAGRITATLELVFLTGWAPADNQPKPLRPGSASHRLAEALDTTETPLRD